MGRGGAPSGGDWGGVPEAWARPWRGQVGRAASDWRVAAGRGWLLGVAATLTLPSPSMERVGRASAAGSAWGSSRNRARAARKTLTLGSRPGQAPTLSHRAGVVGRGCQEREGAERERRQAGHEWGAGGRSEGREVRSESGPWGSRGLSARGAGLTGWRGAPGVSGAAGFRVRTAE